MVSTPAKIPNIFSMDKPCEIRINAARGIRMRRIG